MWGGLQFTSESQRLYDSKKFKTSFWEKETKAKDVSFTSSSNKEIMHSVFPSSIQKYLQVSIISLMNYTSYLL